MKLSELYTKNLNSADKKPVISIEIFPPKAVDDNEFSLKKEQLFCELAALNKILKPSLVSITYGAAGSNSKKSDEIIRNMLEKFDYSAIMPHFTCVCSKKRFIEEDIGILDLTPAIENTIALSDVYIGDSGTSVTSLFGVAGKPLFIFNNNIHTLPEKDDWRGERINCPSFDVWGRARTD